MLQNESFLDYIPERWRGDALRMAEALRSGDGSEPEDKA